MFACVLGVESGILTGRMTSLSRAHHNYTLLLMSRCFIQTRPAVWGMRPRILTLFPLKVAVDVSRAPEPPPNSTQDVYDL